MNRLAFVRDVCHIGDNPHPSWHTSDWHRTGLGAEKNLKNGFSHAVISTRFFAWRRHFTHNGLPPSPLPLPSAWVTLDEWIPGVWPSSHITRGWFRAGSGSHHGIAFLHANNDVSAEWSTHAKRHLKTFFAKGGLIREGTFADVEADMLRSQVPRSMSLALAKIVEYRLATSPETIEILVAENAQGMRIGCFVSANDDARKESMYIMGYFLPEAAKLQPMTGLVYAWLLASHARGYTAANFGLMLGPDGGRWDPWWGLSNFKTHFGITRVHLPPGYWKIRTEIFPTKKSS